MNELLERCAGMDVHKKSIVTCVMIGSGKNMIKKIETFGTTTSELYKLAAWLSSYNIKEVAMESTGIYWICVHNILEKDFKITLTNPKHMKNIPGKKTDVKDAEWICKLLKHGLLRKSFIPPKHIRNLRDLTRLRRKYTQQKTSANNRIIKFLESSNIKLKSVVSNISGKASRAIIKAIASGVTDPNELAKLATTNLRASKKDFIEALTGVLTEHDIYMVKKALTEVEFYEMQIEDLDVQIKMAQQTIQESIDILQTFPGIGNIGAVAILAEIGTNMEQFPTKKHLTSWAGIAPGNNESAGKTKSARISKGNHNLKITLVQAAWAGVREKHGHWKSLYYRIKARIGAKKAIIAVARQMLETIYEALSSKTKYQDLNLRDNSERIERSKAYYIKKLEELAALPAQ